MPPVIVIGAGHNGLAAAFYLANAGLQPLVIEARGEVGGGAITRELHPGFRCATLTHETLLHERVVRDMNLRRHGLTFAAGDVERCALRTSGPPLVIYRDAARTATELARRSPLDVERFLDFAVTLRRYGSVIAPLLDTPSPRRRGGRLRDQLTWLTAGRRFRALGTRDAHRLLQWMAMPIADLVEDAFGDELMQAAIAAPPLIGTRLGPRSGGTTFLLLLREAHRQLAGDGGRLAIGGPGALTTAMSRAATEAGARIELNVPVERILVEGRRVRGVIAGGRDHAADVVVSAIDPKTTWWLAGQPEIDPAMSHGMRHYRTGGTLAKINLALSALPSFTGVDADRAALSGRIQVGPTIEFLERAFDPAKYGAMSPEPWLDICLPSLSDSSLAPHGAHVASIYAHYVPRDLRSADWSDAANVLLKTVMDTLERYAPGVSSLVVAAEVITPRMLQREYGFAGGHVFHGEMTLDQMFGMRPVFGYGHYRTPVDGLYLCSAGTHPGGFMTGASGRLAALQLVRDLKGI